MLQNQNRQQLITDLKELVDKTRGQVAAQVNSAMVVLYWEIGKRINEDVLENKRAEYGKEVILHISQQLTIEFGNSFSEKNIRKMMQFASVFDNFEIVASAMRQLSWTHFLLLIPISQETKRNFYLEVCKIENWSVRTLREKINSLLFERTAISKKPEQIINKELKNWSENNILNPDIVFKDPYFLDFLELKDTFSEKDLEESIIVELQKFISELGSDFAFLARQKRITIDNKDYYIDLLFYHRKLKSLVVIELKIGEFEASHKGQMELYLSYLNKYEKVDGENPPIGLILCSGKNSEHIELMNLEGNNIKIAEYLLILPSEKVLLDKLNRSIEIARSKFENKNKSNIK
ncbi:PDDEXK nuclease domain-containing protein [Chryseobacterium arthrosphaerae]|uniref:PDDEXK nuclease domain-containing protein n=1 Tax=Chryseobacterium arthrosphaerae TaxID=651561 RepID=UPI0023E08F35|nr:PDDEXK nuclease domain-containing protein [Chryseobacterium arthrosphaerae]WES99432.1 PDDEXK nuclease domain-containing protein [Chryseobacterium arthrosphaerae]